jgi:integrase
VICLLDRVVDRGTPIAANRTLSAIRTMFNWAVDRSLVDTTPCARISPPSEERSRDRVLAVDEIRLVWNAAEEVGWPFGKLVQLLLLTGQRRDEVARARRVELKENGTLWTIPGARTKNGVEHDVPLSAQAQELIMSLPRIGQLGLLFTTTGEAPYSGYSKAKARLDGVITRMGHEQRLAVLGWRLHDLRRTVASGMARLGVAVHVIEAVLNHSAGEVSGIARVYNRHKYLDEKRWALDTWASFVLRQVQNDPNAMIIRLRA